MTGKVKFYNEQKGYGFITKEDGKDIFFHINHVRENKILQVDQIVIFDVIDGFNGKDMATNVMVVE